jgi:hypothetical protein
MRGVGETLGPSSNVMAIDWAERATWKNTMRMGAKSEFFNESP